MRCAECGRPTDAGHFAGWIADRIDEPGEPPQLAVWCSECAEREQLERPP